MSSQETATVSAAAWDALQGAFDLQIHVAPDVIERRIDDLDLAKEFLAHGLKGFVLKSHYFPTAERAKVVTKAVPGIHAYGAITLNHSVGGLNPVAVELAGRSGNKIVWMPTVDAANETAGRPDGTKTKLPFWAKIQLELAATGINPPPMTVIDEAGNLTNAARTVLELIKKYDMILATGHLGKKEILALVKTAKEIGLRRVLVTHAEFPSQSLTAQEQCELADLGAVIEHCFTTMHTGKSSWEGMFEATRKVGTRRNAAFDRSRADHQPARGRGLRDVRAEAARRGFHRGRDPPHGGDESRLAARRRTGKINFMADQKSILVVSAHAADFVWRAGGAIALYAARGYRVRILCLSFGERGESQGAWKQPGMTVESVKQIRRAESDPRRRNPGRGDPFFRFRRLSAS